MTNPIRNQAELLATIDHVRITINNPLLTAALINDGGTLYRVVLYCDGAFSCSCDGGWTHSRDTDLCSHALAVKLAIKKETS